MTNNAIKSVHVTINEKTIFKSEKKDDIWLEKKNRD